MAVKASLSKDSKKMILEVDLETPTPSSSGKTLVVASTRGNTPLEIKIDGQPVILGLNAYIKPSK